MAFLSLIRSSVSDYDNWGGVYGELTVISSPSFNVLLYG